MAYLETVASSNLGWQNFFSAKLTSSLTASDTDIPMDAVPSITEGVLVVDWDVSASREVIFFNSKTASKVVCPSAADGRGFDGSTATTHASGANVIMAPVADYFRYIKYIATTSTAAWKPLGYTPDSITDNGNRSYTLVFNSVDLTSFISNGMRVKGTPTTAQPTRCTSLNGSSQYYSKTSPAGMSWTDDFAAGAWVKLTSYALGTIISRYDGTSGWALQVNANGTLILLGRNGGVANQSHVVSYQSIPLSRWVHVAAQLDMSAFATGATNSYIMIDGVDVPAVVQRGGTNPTSLAQAGSLFIGADNSTTPANFFSGKIAQAFVSSAKITQANVRVIKNQGLTSALCTTHSIASAYSFDNSITDINTGNANNLTAQGSAVATNADSPFGQNDAGVPGTTEWGIVTSRAFSTNTTLTVQVPEGSAWPTSPTSAAISAMSYSTEKLPYGFPGTRVKWELITLNKAQSLQSTPGSGTWYNLGSVQLNMPIGEWAVSYQAMHQNNATAGDLVLSTTLSTANNSQSDSYWTCFTESNSVATVSGNLHRAGFISLSAATPYYLNTMSTTVVSSTIYTRGELSPTILRAECAYL